MSIKEQIEKARETIKSNLSVDNGVLVLAEGTTDKLIGDFCEANDIKRDTLVAAQNFASVVGSALALEAAEPTAAAFKKNKELQQVTGSVQVGNTTIDVGYRRKAEFPDPQNKGQKITKFGFLDVSYDTKLVKSVKTIRGEVANYFDGLSD